MAFTYVTITHAFGTAEDTPAAGTVEFAVVEPMHNGVTVVAAPVTARLTPLGVLTQVLAANTDPDTIPSGTTYKVTERIDGQPLNTYYIQVPHDQGATINLAALNDWVGGGGVASGLFVATINGESPDGSGNVVVSASDVGAQPADGDLTGLAGLGDGVPVRVSGTWGLATGTRDGTRYLRDDGTWQAVSGGGGAVSSVNGQTGAVVLTADSLADGSSKVQMTTTERSKLTGVAAGATANATDAQLRDRSTHTGTQTINTLATTGTASASTFLRGDGTWAGVASSGGVSLNATRTIYAADPPAGLGLSAIVADGTTDDGPTLIAQMAYLKTNYGSGTVVLPAGKTIRSGPLGTMPTKVQLVSVPGTTLYFSGLTGTQTGVSVNDHDFHPLVGVSLRGPGKTTTTTGLNIAGSGNVFDHITVYQFGTDANLNNADTYINKFLGGSLGDATLCVNLGIQGSGTSNAGERNAFTGVTFFNSVKAALLDSGGGSTIFSDCSFDYCATFADLFSGHAEFTGCHFESADTATPNGYLFNADFNSVTTFTGCRFIMGKFGAGGLRWIINPAKAPWNYGFGRISFGFGNRAFFIDSTGNGQNRSSDELVYIPAGTTTSGAIETPFVHKWGPVTAAPAWNDGQLTQAITVSPSCNVASGTVTVTASSAAVTNAMPVRVAF